MTSDKPCCQIQWIDSEGRPTTDVNPSVGIMRCTAIDRKSDGTIEVNVSEFPVCEAHARLSHRNSCWAGHTSRWDFTRYAEQDETE